MAKVFRDSCGKWASLSFVVLLCVSTTRGQGPAPETAPPLFPGGGLVSYNSVFTTRGLMPQSAGNIPATARPTYTHEGDFNFTWGFYRNFDLTILLPIVTNHFDMAGTPTIGGTGLGDAMLLVKYRFYRRDSQRGTTQASVNQNLRDRYGSRGFAVIGFKFDTMRDMEDPIQFAKTIGVHYPLAVATEDVKQGFGGIEGLPTTMLYDRHGILRTKVVGFEYTDNVESAMKPLL